MYKNVFNKYKQIYSKRTFMKDLLIENAFEKQWYISLCLQ